MNLVEDLKKIIRGDVRSDAITLTKFSRDTSLFEVRPKVVVSPKDTADVKAVVKYVAQNKEWEPELSITARSGGTDMGGGPLNNSIILDFTKYFKQIKKINDNYAIVEPGVYYRDFEKETLKKGLI